MIFILKEVMSIVLNTQLMRNNKEFMLKYIQFIMNTIPGTDLCSKCDMRSQWERDNTVQKLSVYRLEGCFLK